MQPSVAYLRVVAPRWSRDTMEFEEDQKTADRI